MPDRTGLLDPGCQNRSFVDCQGSLVAAPARFWTAAYVRRRRLQDKCPRGHGLARSTRNPTSEQLSRTDLRAICDTSLAAGGCRASEECVRPRNAQGWSPWAQCRKQTLNHRSAQCLENAIGGIIRGRRGLAGLYRCGSLGKASSAMLSQIACSLSAQQQVTTF